MTPGRVDEVCAIKDESKICLTCPMAAVFCDSAKVADISNPSMAKTAFAFGIYGLLSYMDGLTRANSPLSRGETNRTSTVSDAGPIPCLTSGQSVHRSKDWVRRAHFLGLSLDSNTRRDGPAQRSGGPDGQTASLTRRIVAMGWPVPLAELVSNTRRRAPHAISGPPRLLCGEKTSSHIPPEKRGQMEMVIRNFPANTFSSA